MEKYVLLWEFLCLYVGEVFFFFQLLNILCFVFSFFSGVSRDLFPSEFLFGQVDFSPVSLVKTYLDFTFTTPCLSTHPYSLSLFISSLSLLFLSYISSHSSLTFHLPSAITFSFSRFIFLLFPPSSHIFSFLLSLYPKYSKFPFTSTFPGNFSVALSSHLHSFLFSPIQSFSTPLTSFLSSSYFQLCPLPFFPLHFSTFSIS